MIEEIMVFFPLFVVAMLLGAIVGIYQVAKKIPSAKAGMIQGTLIGVFIALILWMARQ